MSMMPTNCCATTTSCSGCCVVSPSGEADVVAIPSVEIDHAYNYGQPEGSCRNGYRLPNNIVFDSCWFGLPRAVNCASGWDYDPAFRSSTSSDPVRWINFNGGCEEVGEYRWSELFGGQAFGCPSCYFSTCAEGSEGHTLCRNSCYGSCFEAPLCGSTGTQGHFSCDSTSSCPNGYNCPPTYTAVNYTAGGCCTQDCCTHSAPCCDDGAWRLPVSSPQPLATQQCGWGLTYFEGVYGACNSQPCNSFAGHNTFCVLTGHIGTGNDRTNPRVTHNNGSLQPITETFDIVATIQRTSAAANVDYGDLPIRISFADTTAGSQYATPQFPNPVAPYTRLEMLELNGQCGFAPPLPPNQHALCGNETTCVEHLDGACGVCGVAKIQMEIWERGATQAAMISFGGINVSNLTVGEYYEIVEVGTMKWKCYGWIPSVSCASSTPAIGDLFLATECSNTTGCATQLYCDCADPQPMATGTCLPVQQHIFEVKGRGHIVGLLDQLVENFDSGLWHYRWEMTGTTARSINIVGYSSTMTNEDDWVGGSLIASSCCGDNTPAWRFPSIPAWEADECKGCVNGLYYHGQEVINNNKTAFRSIPDVYVQLWSGYSENHNCAILDFEMPEALWWVDPCAEYPTSYVAEPAQEFSVCWNTNHDYGGGWSAMMNYVTDWVVVKKGSNADSYAMGWAVDQSHGFAYQCTDLFWYTCENPLIYNVVFLTE